MSTSAGRLLAVMLSLAAGLAPTGARADDWLQFRHDERRTNASKDRLALPLTDLWSIPIGQRAPATVWRGRLCFIGRDARSRTLVCADGRTGVFLWMRRLTGLPQPVPFETGPAVTASGVVYVGDWDPTYHLIPVTGPAQLRDIGHQHFHVRVFRALDGQAVGSYPPPGIETHPVGERTIVAPGLQTEPGITAFLAHAAGAIESVPAAPQLPTR